MPDLTASLVPAAAALAALSGVPGLFLPRRSALGQRSATILLCLAAAAGLAGAVAVLAGGAGPFRLELAWPAVGDVALGVDGLSAFFLVPIFLVGALGSIYGLGYWPQRGRPRSARKLQLFWGLLNAGMSLLVIARHALVFLLGWETMALAAFFLMTAEDEREECRTAGWIYFIATHLGTLILFAFFALWRWATGSFALTAAIPGAIAPATLGLLFFLALVGFGIKAGIMPLHFWLPGAHANAPSHVSALLSGVMLKMGIYGLVRVLALLPDPPAAWGVVVLALGMASGLLGVVFALAQHDLKRLLAYHSVENIGIILMGLGIALLGRSFGQGSWVVLGFAGALLHVWNHGLFKSLLFFGAGAVVHRSGTRQLDRLGGLAKVMPLTAGLFLVGAVAICGLPPLNGFVSELLVYLGSARTVGLGSVAAPAAATAVPVLAMIGALAVACFVKVYGSVFLGTSRTELACSRREVPPSMLLPMIALAALCLFIGAAPAVLAGTLDRATALWAGGGPSALPRLLDLAPLREIGAVSSGLAIALAMIVAISRARWRSAKSGVTWDCGYARPTPRMQYTAASFARPLTALFSWALRQRERRPAVEGVFPAPSSLESHVEDATLDRLIVPASARIAERFGWFRRFQQGLTQWYLLYILVAILALLGTLLPFGDIFSSLIGR